MGESYHVKGIMTRKGELVLLEKVPLEPGPVTVTITWLGPLTEDEEAAILADRERRRREEGW